MNTSPEAGTRGDQALADIKEALRSDEVRLRLVYTFTHGRGVQVYVKTRKVGPLLLPAEGQDISDVLAMVGSLAVSA